MREQILELIQNHPRHYVGMIKRNSLMLSWVMSNTRLTESSSNAEHIRSALYSETNICNIGKEMRWIGINDGWGNCGKSSMCKCAFAQVSNAVKLSKSNRTSVEIARENHKRELTNMERYGVANSAQTKDAILAHKEFYSDATKVATAVQNYKNTMLTKHGVENAQELEQVRTKTENTNVSRYGTKNVMKNSSISAKSATNRMINFDKIANLESNYDAFVSNVNDRYRVRPLITKNEYALLGGVGTRPSIKFECTNCDHIFEKRFDYRVPPYCKNCNHSESSFCSKEEQEVFDAIRIFYSGKMISGDRSAINPHQLDIYLPDVKLAIEYCGLYWHSECGGNSEKMRWNYHALKMKKCQEKGIRLITIFSDEWCNSRSIVEQKLKNILGAQTNSVIGARKCVITEVDFKIASAFYDAHHIQGGAIRNKINIALSYDTKIVAMMSFKKNLDSFELTRYASSIRVIGGASRLLKYFVDQYKPKNIISFADLRWSVGDLYFKLNFRLIGEVPPMQSYVENYKIRHNKLKFKRKKMSERLSNESEWEYLRRQGYDRIWDCGKLKFELICK